jgi:hypothetical protein
MQLVRVEHIRCGDRVGATYMWAADTVSYIDFLKDCESASNALLAAESEFDAAQRTSAPSSYYLNEPPKAFLAARLGMRVDEMLKEWEAHKAAAAERVLARNRARRNFADHMHDRGYRYLYEIEPPLAHVIEWTHNHRLTIETGANEDSEPQAADILGRGEDYPRYVEL